MDASLDIMIWALEQNDPAGWLHMPKASYTLIDECDGPFKIALDQVKYASRLSDANPAQDRKTASVFLLRLEALLIAPYLFAEQPKVADMAILPFVHQFAFVDKIWFDAQSRPRLKRWLEAFLISPTFLGVMDKYSQWRPSDLVMGFPE